MAVFKGRSYKVGWNKGFQFYCPEENGTKGSLSINTIFCGSKKDTDPLQVISVTMFGSLPLRVINNINLDTTDLTQYHTFISGLPYRCIRNSFE